MSELRAVFPTKHLNGYVQFCCNRCGVILEYVDHVDVYNDENIEQDLRDHLMIFCKGGNVVEK